MPDLDYDLLDFDTRDEIDEERDAALASIREEITGLPTRPGTLR